jgi:hypothetical protein
MARHHSSKKMEHHSAKRSHYELGEPKGGRIYDKPHMEGVGPEYYSGAAARHAMEKKDEGMIFENHAAIANLPQEVMIKPWPMAKGYLPEVLDDTIDGIDRQMAYDNKEKSDGFYPKKI